MYIWIKAFHIIFVTAWIAGLLIYPRYKLHQMSSVPGEPLFETMRSASIKLRKIILTPAVIIVWFLGLTMLFLNPQLFSSVWIHLKLVLVLGLTAVHGFLISLGKRIDGGIVGVSMTQLKLLNELPFVILVGVVILAVVKPF